MSTVNAQAEGRPVEPRRVVEVEIHRPKFSEIQLPEVDLEPLAEIGKGILVTALGAGLLLGKGVVKAVEAAQATGRAELDRPGSWLHRTFAKDTAESSAPGQTVHVPIVPLDDYDTLSEGEIVTRMEKLSPEQIETVRAYEATHAGRVAVLAAADRLLGQA